MINTLGILFYVRADKSRKTGEIPIYLRITVNGHRAETSIKRKIDPTRWDSNKGRVKGTRDDVREMNQYMDLIRAKVQKIHADFLEKGQVPTAQGIKDKLLGNPSQVHYLIPLFEQHNNEIKALAGKDYSENTYRRYRTSLKHTKDFLKLKYHVTDIAISEVNLSFITGFEFYLKSKKKPCSHNTTLKNIEILRKVVHIALKNEWIHKDPFLHYKSKYEPTDRGYLTSEELYRLQTKELSNDRIDRVRDIFVFCCYTGLSYVDVNKLTQNHLVTWIDGKTWIDIGRTKTGSISKIPLLPQAMAILDKYRGYPGLEDGKLLPMLSNQKMNAYLKEIADLCEISKNLTFHVSRHTFATTVTLSHGVSTESVQKMLGHKSIRTTQVYAKIVDRRVGEEMERLVNSMSLESQEGEYKKGQA